MNYKRNLYSTSKPKTTKKKKDPKAIENKFASQLTLLGLQFDREVRLFANEVGLGNGIRKRLKDKGWGDWRFDFYIPKMNMFVEVQGGIWIKGGHTTGTGIERDCKKAFEARKLGYQVMNITSKMVREGEVALWIKDVVDNIIIHS